MGKSRIFQASIHTTDYLSKYQEQSISPESLIDTGGRSCESLSGEWRFSIDPYDTALRAQWYKTAGMPPRTDERPPDFSVADWESITVPSCWNLMNPSYFWYEGAACYYRSFQFVHGNDERQQLLFEGVSGDSYIFLNNQQIGFHRGGSTSFCVEVTEHLREGFNTLFIVVNNTRSDDRVPMSNFDWFNYGGIYRDVKLLRVPSDFIKRYSFTLSEDGGIDVRVEVSKSESQADSPAVVRVPELNLEASIELEGGVGTVHLDGDPERWSPAMPKRYEVTVEYGKDQIHDLIGFRTIERKGGKLLLNGEPLFLRGICMHEDDPENGKAVQPEDLRRDLEWASELGCNFVRLAHYPHSALAAQLADEVGLMLWEEIPVYWAIDFQNTATLENARSQLTELIRRDINRASVIVWSVGNENPDTDERLLFMRELVRTARSLDGSRLVSAACLYDMENYVISDRLASDLDLIGINEYFGWYDPEYEKLPRLLENSKPDRPVVITECGGGAKAGHRGTVDEIFTEDKQKRIYERQIQAISGCTYIKGITPWILFDFRSPKRANGFQRFYNRKGLIDADHMTPKIAFQTLKTFYESSVPTRLSKDG